MRANKAPRHFNYKMSEWSIKWSVEQFYRERIVYV